MAVVAWMTVIFLVSATPDLRSGFQPLWDRILRKGAHVLEYAVLAWLTGRAGMLSGMARGRALWLGALLAVAYAASDEYHQSFVPGRDGNALDVGIDAAGAVIGTLAYRRRLPRPPTP